MVAATICLLSFFCLWASAIHAKSSSSLHSLKVRRARPGRSQQPAKEEPDEVEPSMVDKSYHGLPAYYEGKVPAHFFNMSHMEKQDFFFRIERWHERLAEAQKRGRCRSPKPGEKVVYFVQHADAVPKQEDAPVWALGEAQARNFRIDPAMAKALSWDPKERAQLLMVSPARKALQTAVLGFSDVLPDAAWEIDSDVRGFGWVEGTLVPQFGAAALYELASNRTYSQSSTNLLSQYRNLPEGWYKATKPHKDRWFDFVEHLSQRPEDRIIVVTHSGMIKQANITKTHSGEIHLAALLPDKTWRRLSPPDCWPQDV